MRIAYYAYNSCRTTDGVEECFFEDCRNGLTVCNCLTVDACCKLHRLVCKKTKHEIDVAGIAQTVCAVAHSDAYIRQVYANKLVCCHKHENKCRGKAVRDVEKIAYFELYGENAISAMLNLAIYNGKWLEHEALGLICLLHCYIDIYTQVYLYGFTLNRAKFATKESTFKELCDCLMAMFVDTNSQNALYGCITDIRTNRVYANLFTYTDTINKLRYRNNEKTVAATWACIQRVIAYLTKNSKAYVNQSAYTWFNALYDFWQR